MHSGNDPGGVQSIVTLDNDVGLFGFCAHLKRNEMANSVGGILIDEHEPKKSLGLYFFLRIFVVRLLFWVK